MKKLQMSLILTLGLAISSISQAAVYTIDQSHSEVGFRVRHIMSNTKGIFQKFSGTVEFDEKNLAGIKVNASIETASVNTNEPKRDAHLQSADFFDVAKFPAMNFKSTSAKSVGSNKLEIKGDLTLHGVTKPVTLNVDYLGAGNDPWGGTRAGFSVSGKINRKDYGIVWNKTLDNGGVLVGEEVEIQIEVEAVKAK